MSWLRGNWPLVCVAWCLLVRLGLAAGTDIYPDEAYYWAWSKHLQLSYFDHPALIAWSIALFGIRPGALLWGLVTFWGVHQLTLCWQGTRSSAWWATALFASTPAATLLGTLSTPDAPLLAFWVWTLVALSRRRPALTGLLWGLAMLSKYNGILLALPVVLTFFRRPTQLAAATLIALGVTSPTLIWNATHNWEGFRFQLDHGLGGGGGVRTFLEFLAGQLGMGGPVLVVLTLWWLARAPGVWLLKLATVIPLVFFGYASWNARGEANWAAAAWLGASVGIALTGHTWWKRSALALNLAVTTVGTLILLFPPAQIWGTPAIQKLHGWSWLSRLGEERLPVLTNSYQLSSLVWLYSKVPSTTVGGRRSQYDLWPKIDFRTGTDALWVNEGEGPPSELLNRFESATPLDWPLDERQRANHPFKVYRLSRAKSPP